MATYHIKIDRKYFPRNNNEEESKFETVESTFVTIDGSRMRSLTVLLCVLLTIGVIIEIGATLANLLRECF